jgi:putative toxin-antitoxin system antitoxin component (TIGR02293 family)
MSSRSPEEILGMPKSRHKGDSGRAIIKGLPIRCLNAFQRITAATEEELLHILWMSPRTFKTGKQSGRLSPAESDRLYGATRILESVLMHFDNNEKHAQAWLRVPASKEHPVPPISLMGTFAGLELTYHYLEGAYFEFYLLGKNNPSNKGKREPTDYPDPLSVLGLKRSMDIDDRIRKGFPYRSYELLRKKSQFSVKEMDKMLWVSSTTLSKCSRSGHLPGDVSNRLYRVAVVFFFMNMLGGYNAGDAQELMHREFPRLGNRRPIDLLHTDPDVDEVIGMACQVLDGAVA